MDGDEAFGCLITKEGKGYYDNKTHCFIGLQKMFAGQDVLLLEKNEPELTFASVSITPLGNVLLPDKWILRLYGATPTWFNKHHEKKAWSMHKLWLQWLRSKTDKTKFPNNPFLTKPDMSKLKNKYKAQARYTVRDYVIDSVGNSIWDSVKDSVWWSLGIPVEDSILNFVKDFSNYGGRSRQIDWMQDWLRSCVWDYVLGLAGYMFPKSRLFIDNDGIYGDYAFQSHVEHCQAGIVPVYFGGKEWHLFGSPGADGKVIEL